MRPASSSVTVSPVPPQSLRPWARYLAARGLTVALPLLPGHGTRWQDMQVTGWQDWYAEVDRELRVLRERCARVFVAGLSMGGALALRLAAKHGEAVSGVVVVNPANRMHGVAQHALPLLRHLVPATKGIASDIAKLARARSWGTDRVPCCTRRTRCAPSSGSPTATCRR
ncbi:alpha/beta fold hydrolase [Streptomyces violaceorubidus]